MRKSQRLVALAQTVTKLHNFKVEAGLKSSPPPGLNRVKEILKLKENKCYFFHYFLLLKAKKHNKTCGKTPWNKIVTTTIIPQRINRDFFAESHHHDKNYFVIKAQRAFLE